MPCRTCGSSLPADQRYCLECGARHGPPRLDWKAMVLGTEAHQAGAPAVVEEDHGAGPGLPTPRIAAALVLGVLAFGVVLGNAAGPGASAADAGGRSDVTILARATPAPPAAAAAPVLAPPAPTPAPPADTGTTDLPDAGSAVDGATADDAGTTVDAPAPTDDASGVDESTPTDDSTGTDDTTTTGDMTTSAPKLPPVKHVWVVALTGHSYAETFGPDSPAPYLSAELRSEGTLLPWYHAAGHDPAAGGVALLGGQKDAAGPFDAHIQTLPDQLTGLGRTWKTYVEGATAGLNPGENPCARPADQAPRNPFLRFASIAAAPECGSSMAETDALAADVADTDSAPTFSYILPGPAHDGSTSLADADAWLKATLPTILASKAYADGGLVVVTFDAGAPDDDEAGGGRVGALLLSPYVVPGATVEAPYDPFSLLKSIEDLFGVEPLGYAAQTRLKAFGPKVYAAWSPAAAGGR